MGYSKKDFQAELHKAWKAAGKDEMNQGKARQQVCLPRQIPIITKFGFEGSKKGVSQSLAACMAQDANYTEHMRWMHNALGWLVNPTEQKANPNFVPDAQVPHPELEDPNRPLPGQKGCYYMVVGGETRGGIVVRRGEDKDSPFYSVLLKTGAKVKALEDVTNNNRLKYELCEGDGPECGWVTTEVKEKKLVIPLEDYIHDNNPAKHATYILNRGWQPRGVSPNFDDTQVVAR